jgi:hypothetical protein
MDNKNFKKDSTDTHFIRVEGLKGILQWTDGVNVENNF